jgi:hypothetical protein
MLWSYPQIRDMVRRLLYAHPRERGFTHGAIDCRRPLVAKPDHRFVSANG